MMRRPLILAVIVLLFVGLACNVSVNLPVTRINTGPTQTDEISVPVPDASSADLTLEFGYGELNLAPGAEEALVEGTATYNVQELKPKTSTSGNNIRVETGDLNIKGIPSFSNNVKNTWDLKLDNMPMDLHIKAGAYKGRYELGGLSLTSLDISDGASDVELNFSEPNLVEMSSLHYETGASNIHLIGLGNANFQSMDFHSGAGNYSLDFSGDLQRDATISIESGVSHLEITVPQGVDARVAFEGSLTNINASGGWSKSGNDYTLSGSGPSLTINVKLGAGSLDLLTK
jgi:hypothetical protein